MITTCPSWTIRIARQVCEIAGLSISTDISTTLESTLLHAEHSMRGLHALAVSQRCLGGICV